MAAAFPAGIPDKEDDKEPGCVENKDDVDEFCIGKKDSAVIGAFLPADSFCSLCSKLASLSSNSLIRRSNC